MYMRSRPGVVGREVATRKRDVTTWLSCSRQWLGWLDVATRNWMSRHGHLSGRSRHEDDVPTEGATWLSSNRLELMLRHHVDVATWKNGVAT